MKKLLSIAIVTIGISLSSVALADHERNRQGYRHHNKQVAVHNRQHRNYGHQQRNRHVKKHRSYHHEYQRPRHYRQHREVRHYRGDDLYKWVGGIYILNEILHHNHH